MPEAIGIIECSSIAMGYLVQDSMLKAGDVQLLVARSICSGKYMVAVGGDVAGVEASMKAGMEDASEGIIDQVVIPNIHPSIFPAITGCVELHESEVQSLGIVETYSAVSAILAADAAVKAGSVVLFRVHLAMALGGKGFILMTGDVSACQAGVEAGAAAAAERGLLVNKVVIPGPRRELFGEYI